MACRATMPGYYLYVAMDKINTLLDATYANPVFGDTIPQDPERRAQVSTQIGVIVARATPVFLKYVHDAIPGVTDAEAEQRANEILPKTMAFAPALISDLLVDPNGLAAIGLNVTLMYLPNQEMDNGDLAALQASAVVGKTDAIKLLGNAPKDVFRWYNVITHINNHTSEFALPEDAPHVRKRLYGDVLNNEALVQMLSAQYLAEGRSQAFLDNNARRLAELTTIDAGFPSITASLYALLRKHDTSLPPLGEVDSNPDIQKLLQVCNVVARLWDDMGDAAVDAGKVPSRGIFVLNPFNQYHPGYVRRFCELASITDAQEIQKLDQAMKQYHADPEQNGKIVDDVLLGHIRAYMANLDTNLVQAFRVYIDLCKRVMEISWVNRMGDIALTQE